MLIAILLFVLGAQLAHWTWVFFAPASAPSTSTRDATADLAIAARLFGGTAISRETSTAANTSGLKLKGVVAPTPGTAASAIFNTGSGRDIAVFVDQEVQPGVKLVEVLPDAVTVSRAGVRERIELEARKGKGSGRAVTDARGLAPQFKLNVASSGNTYSLSRKELDDTLKDPQQYNLLGRISPNAVGGVKIEAAPPGSLSAKLGLQPGDLIKKVNGQVVLSPADLALLYQRFGTVSSIQAEVQRGTSTVQLTYAIQP
ncbi:hypothetical protein BWI17_12460 [Betaproteobacteria bacterium GR16-43]|nr:hypothetical protein BWI17_12460 [Betaproteobacteria bacterium GR16-43]